MIKKTVNKKIARRMFIIAIIFCISVGQTSRVSFMNFKSFLDDGSLKVGYEILNYTLFDEIRGFSNDLAPVKSGGKWGFVDRNGKLVIDLQFDEVSDFKRGRADVVKTEIKDSEKSVIYGSIDRRGNFTKGTQIPENLNNIKPENVIFKQDYVNINSQLHTPVRYSIKNQVLTLHDLKGRDIDISEVPKDFIDDHSKLPYFNRIYLENINGRYRMYRLNLRLNTIDGALVRADFVPGINRIFDTSSD